jgi:hypothetical protein
MKYDPEELPPRIRSKFYIAESGCWLWTAGATRGGYGTVTWQGLGTTAHRVTYSLLVGDIPDGLQIDHLCRVRNCVNPEHLEAVTPWENASRGNAWKPRAMCNKGIHPMTPDNLYVRPNGIRRCRACKRAASRASYLRLKERAA